jgi:RNA polymerase sigma-70 factor (ECF subfamily)
VGDAALAEDVVQEAAVIALKKLDQYQPGTNFAAWIGQIVRNVAFNRARDRRRRSSPSGSPLLDPANLLRERPPGVEPAAAEPAALDSQDLVGQVHRALEDVGEIPRACLLLRTVEGLSYAEISQLLEIPEGTAMSHVQAVRLSIAAVSPRSLGAQGTGANG